MKNIAPSFAGTTIATVLAALYNYFFNVGFHLWTDAVRALILGGPIVVLITYTIMTSLLEQHTEKIKPRRALGPLDYPFRIAAQTALGLALAAMSENIKFYVILFMAFVTINTVISIFSRDVLKRLVFTDVFNLFISAGYAWAALSLYSLANGFEMTYPAFAVDQVSYGFRVTQLRGEQTNTLLALAAFVGGMVVNIIQVVNWPGWKDIQPSADLNPGVTPLPGKTTR